MKNTNKPKEVEILDEDLNLDTHVTVNERRAERIWPEHYESYLGDGIYVSDE